MSPEHLPQAPPQKARVERVEAGVDAAREARAQRHPLLRWQGTLGNQQVARLVQARRLSARSEPVTTPGERPAGATVRIQRQAVPAEAPAATGDRARIDKALGVDGTANDAKDIQNFASASEPEKVRLIRLLMTDWWVGPTGEAAIERCWGSLREDRFVAFVEANRQLWNDSIERGADLEELRPYKALQKAFEADVLGTARGHLRTNAGVVGGEMARFGISGPGGAADPAPTAGQADELARLAEVARTLRDCQKSQEKARRTVVGWRVDDAWKAEPDAHGKARFKVMFDPKEKPLMDPAPDPAIPPIDHWGRVVPYELLKPAYDRVSESIIAITSRHPSLYALARQDRSTVTGGLADAKDPRAMRDHIGQALRLLATDIDQTQARLGTEIHPLDLVPIHRQLMAGAVPGVGARWQTGWRNEIATRQIESHKLDEALMELILQSGIQFAFLLAPLTGGASLLLLMTATAASSAKAFVSAEKYEALAKAAKSTPAPGTELVDAGTVDHARMVAEADQVALALTALATVGAIAETIGPAPAATADGLALAPQTRRLRVSNPALVAEYEQLATRKLPGIVSDVIAAERQTPGRLRLAALRVDFDQLVAEVGQALELTPPQRARGHQTLGEARDLARTDFNQLQTKVTKRLRADPELKAMEERLIAAGDMENKATGAVRLRTQKDSGDIAFEPVNIEHGTRLSDNPWAAKDGNQMMLTDAAQNQQYLESLRQYGGVWPTDAIEDFVVRHRLNSQGIDFRPGQR